MIPARHSPVESPFLPRAALALALLAGGLLSACRVTEDFRDPEPELFAWSPPLPVTLSNELRGMKPATSAAGSKTRFKVGKLLQRLFLSSDGRYFLSYVDHDIELELRENLWHTRYSLVLALQNEGTYHLIRASGTANSLEGGRDSGRQAIEACVADLYGQVATLLSPTSASR